ncbi:MAG: HupE/UreJ family protein [Gammaproteobacteria bacterium]|nr:HupE/UreJ family protein [Gammaproteobacteria bacterium]NNC58213.1 HupE/UreJ family protein [Woeseiaceae bacterium]
MTQIYRRIKLTRWLGLLLTLCIVIACPRQLFAHSLGEGYLFIDVSDSSLSGWVEITLTDLDAALSIDGDSDGKVSEEEMLANFERVRGYVFEHVGIGTGDREYELEFTNYELRNVALSPFLMMHFRTIERQIPDVLHIQYRMLFDIDPQHRGFLVISSNEKGGIVDTGEGVTLIFSPTKTEQDIDLTRLSPWVSFVDFLKHGVWHIWIGFDHVLFLVALILPSVLIRQDARWEPVGEFRQAIWNVVKIITLFTVAHTVTLTLAALDLVRVPGRLVEAVIAASVIIAALNNIFPVIRERIGWVVFLFGLFHGFGFASVLQDLTSNATNLAADLAGFNIGVEIGQLAIMLVVFPLLFVFRSKYVYRQVLLPVGSFVIAVLAAGWLVERVADLEFMPI